MSEAENENLKDSNADFKQKVDKYDRLQIECNAKSSKCLQLEQEIFALKDRNQELLEK